ncbi:CoA transferase [Agromyces aerolatus]|uniref:CoA transferase n=1 Tax=Agromyces sp. LY-1074 TaxID=3074080 RepID=UPI00285D296F|nr:MULTISPECIES: CoA transferase [unclassified Agromyces]MDR5700977.1 CoA transferase [Agromyces sp. LY-1074]MDR5707617.1 CoA transferase [Agromyces sp. LY-1358]
MTGSAEQLVRRVWAELGRDAGELAALDALPAVPLPARLDVSGLAAGAVAAASLAGGVLAAGGARGTAGGGPGTAGGRRGRAWIRLDGDRIATAFTSERWLRVGGERPDVWAPLSGFRRAADGWVRTHANYPHHAAALRRALGLAADAGADRVDASIASRSAADVEASVTAAGGVCVAVRAESPDDDARLRETPLIELGGAELDAAPVVGRVRRLRGDAGTAHPLEGVRVLDLTRVIAGPVGTRTLALLGAEVLRVDSPLLPEPEWQHLDTGAGKRSTLLDLRSAADRARFDELLDAANAVVLGYRPAALARLGLDPELLVTRHPGLVVGQLAAWGFSEADADRRGFDSIVQAASGIAVVESDGERPGALPAQALDHATGYLLAAALVSMLGAHAGRGRIARLSLRRTAAELLGMPRSGAASPARALSDEIAARSLEELRVGSVPEAEPVSAAGADGPRTVRVPSPALAAAVASAHWPAGPRAWGRDAARWAE